MSELREIDKRAIITLKAHRHRLTWQQYQTLRGQVLAGDAEAAMKGLERIIGRKTHDKTASGSHYGSC